MAERRVTVSCVVTGAILSATVAVVGAGISSCVFASGTLAAEIGWAIDDSRSHGGAATVWLLVVGLLVVPLAAVSGGAIAAVIGAFVRARSRRRSASEVGVPAVDPWTHVFVGAIIGLAVASMSVATYCFGVYFLYIHAYANGHYSPDSSERLARIFGEVALLFVTRFGPLGIAAGSAAGAVVSLARGQREPANRAGGGAVERTTSNGSVSASPSLRRLAGSGVCVGLTVAAVPFIGYLYYLFLPGVVRAVVQAPGLLGSVLRDMVPYTLFVYIVLLVPIGATSGALIGTAIWLIRGARIQHARTGVGTTPTDSTVSPLSLIRHILGGVLGALTIGWTALAVYGLGRFLPQAFGHQLESWYIRSEWMGEVFRHVVLVFVLLLGPCAIILGALFGVVVFLVRRAHRRKRLDRLYRSADPIDDDVPGGTQREAVHPLD